MKLGAIHALVVTVCMSAMIGIATLSWDSVLFLEPAGMRSLLVLIGLGLFGEYVALTIDVTANKGTSTITFLPGLATLLLFGPTAAVVFLLITGGIGEFVFRRKRVLKGTFNTAQYVLSMVLAGWVFEWAGGAAQARQPGFEMQILPFSIAAITFLGANQIFVSSAIAISEAQPFAKVFRRLIGKSGTNLLYDWLVSPMAIGLAFLHARIGIPGLLVSFLPLLFIRHSYVTNLALQETNRALLKALVKAIETRDPYTSGHSLRVSALSRRIAETLGVGGPHLEAIETAALLHDIGKIEAIYTEILKKPGDLSDEEREIIQSHVTKGVELLTSLSSFPREVIESVRHHHEREDGRGYPDGISGNRIPLGARIIKVVDAIDAMLSDRPYRPALTLDEVREQLLKYQGTQFNPSIVRTVLHSTLLEEHAADLAAARQELAQRFDQLDDWQTPEPATSHLGNASH